MLYFTQFYVKCQNKRQINKQNVIFGILKRYQTQKKQKQQNKLTGKNFFIVKEKEKLK